MFSTSWQKYNELLVIRVEGVLCLFLLIYVEFLFKIVVFVMKEKKYPNR